MTGLPAGTVTFLFTDIESSSARWEADPIAMDRALMQHDATVRSALERHGGSIFKHLGDGVCAAFESAADAVSAAVDCQAALDAEDWGAIGELPVRMGLHTGDAVSRDGDYFGPSVNRAARVMGAANGGQVTCSATVAALCPEVEVLDCGVHELAGIGEERLFLVVDGTFDDRPIRSAGAAVASLPVVSDILVGRRREVDDLQELLSTLDIVTIVGAGGVGKTRLAIETAAGMAWRFPDGIWLCELSGASSKSVAEVVAETVGVSLKSAGDTTEAISKFLENRRVLLVLDNCEHVVDSASSLVDRLSRLADLTILSTSREPLGVRGEQVWPVRPLGSTEGVELFATRARERNPSFSISDDRAAIVQICERLDGIPLAIELAAARSRALAPEVIAARLDDRFRLLRGGRKGDRHQTLRDTVRWSYELLSEGEARLFNRLTVFAGGFTLDAAEQVCADDLLEQFEIIDLVESLVDKSMIQTAPAHHGRYTMLETLRQFGAEQLESNGEANDLRIRHGQYYRQLAMAEYQRCQGPDEAKAFEAFDADWDNFRATIEMPDAELAHVVDIVTALYPYAEFATRHELGNWVESLVGRPGSHSESQYGSVCAISAAFAALRADYELARDRLWIHLESDPVDLDYVNASHVPAFANLADMEGAELVTKRLLELAEGDGTRPKGRFLARTAGMFFCRMSGDWQGAIEHADAAMSAARESMIPSLIAQAHHFRGMAWARQDPARAMVEQQHCLQLIQDSGQAVLLRIQATMALAEAAIETEDLPSKLRLCGNAVATAAEHRASLFLAANLQFCAAALAESGDGVTALRLLDSTRNEGHRALSRPRKMVMSYVAQDYENRELDHGSLSLLEAAELAVEAVHGRTATSR